MHVISLLIKTLSGPEPVKLALGIGKDHLNTYTFWPVIFIEYTVILCAHNYEDASTCVCESVQLAACVFGRVCVCMYLCVHVCVNCMLEYVSVCTIVREQ